jgi:RNA polymerase primary sigma factor
MAASNQNAYYSSSETASALDIYLREIGRFDRVTPQEEIELAAKIKAGDLEAKETLIRANLRLVVKIAQDYSRLGLPLLDLISEGNLGLIKAVERFDPSKGGKLSTYGAWWIKQSIKRALANQSKTIRLPVHLVDKIARLKRTANQMTEELGREPTDEELGAELGISSSKVSELKVLALRPSSLDEPVGDSQNKDLSEIIGDESAQSPSQAYAEKDMIDDLKSQLEKLDEREADIIRLRFGFNGQRPLTLEEVGEHFGITRERVRQLQNIALVKMRSGFLKAGQFLSRQEVFERNQREEKDRIIREILGKDKEGEE